MKIISKFYSVIIYILKRILVLTEFFLFLRLILKFLGANPTTLVVELIYKYSAILVSPFTYIFPNFCWRGYVIEIATASAMIGYALIIFIIFYLLKIFSKD